MIYVGLITCDLALATSFHHVILLLKHIRETIKTEVLNVAALRNKSRHLICIYDYQNLILNHFHTKLNRASKCIRC